MICLRVFRGIIFMYTKRAWHILALGNPSVYFYMDIYLINYLLPVMDD